MKRFALYLVRFAVIVVAAAAATAGGTWAASQGVPTTASTPKLVAKPHGAAVLMVPDVRNLAFVFAKGALEDAGFAWRVAGKVQGFPANTVVSQSPSPGAKVLDNGAPLVVLTLKRTKGYAQSGEAQNVSPYAASKTKPAGLDKG